MDSTELKRLDALIDRLRATGSAALVPRDAEPLLGQILEPLLADSGYRIEPVGHRRDTGVDFLANKNSSGELEADSIAVEYKHIRHGSVGIADVHRVLGAAMSMGISRAMVVTNARFSFEARETLRRSTPVEVELMDLDALRSWIGRLEEVPKVDINQVNIIRRELSRKLIGLIVNNPRYLDEIEWREMEHLLAEVFEGLGFDAQVTPGSKDGGKDIILTYRVGTSSHTYFVEVKHWRSGHGVGGAVLKDFVKVVVNEEVNGGLFLSSYGFSSNAIESLTEIERKKIRVGAENKVVSLCKSYVKAMHGIWAPEALTDTLFENTQ